MKPTSNLFATLGHQLMLGAAIVANLLGATPSRGMDFWAIENDVQYEMIQTYGYYSLTCALLDACAEKWPDSAPVVLDTQRRFTAAYQKSVKTMSDILLRKNSAWPAWKAEEDRTVASKATAILTNVTRELMTNFIRDVDARCRGSIATPFIETLLNHKPDYTGKPDLEFRDGYRKVFRSSSHATTSGAEFQVSLPQSWSPPNARIGSPSGFASFVSENGRGLQMIGVMMTDYPFAGDEKKSATEIRARFDRDWMRTSVQEMGLQQATYIRSDNQLTLGGQPAGCVEFTFDSVSAGARQPARCLWYMIWQPQSGKCIGLQFIVFYSPLTTGLEDTFRKFEPLFKAIAESFVLGDKKPAGAIADPTPQPPSDSTPRVFGPEMTVGGAPSSMDYRPQGNRNSDLGGSDSRRRLEQQRAEDERRQMDLQRMQWQEKQRRDEQWRRDQERQRQQRKPGWY